MSSDARPLFTVCTPSYNRARLIPRAYESLVQQTLQDFEWVVVDDGSTDNTAEVVAGYVAQGKMAIRYFRKANGGKHTALNLAVREARGALFTVIDSDDWFDPRALEQMKFHWDRIPASEQSKMKGVCGLFAYEDGKVVGDRFPSDVYMADDLDIYLRSIEGDKIGCTRIEVMREFPFPENLSEGVNGVVYLTEALVWHRMGRKYPTRFVNEVFAVKEYQSGGITDRGRIIQARNSRATLLCVYEILTCGRRLPLKHAIKNYSNYIRHSLHERLNLRAQLGKVPSTFYFLACLPIGILLWQQDLRLFRREQRRTYGRGQVLPAKAPQA